MHARTDEEIYVQVPSGIKSSRFWRLKAAVNGTRQASKHWQEFSCDKLVANVLFQQNDIKPCICKRFCDNLDLEQHGDDFLMCGLTSNLELLADEFRISVDDFGWHVALDQKCVKNLLDAMAMNHCESMAALGSKGQESSHVSTEKLDTQEHREFRSSAGICQYMTEQRFDIAFSTKEITREAAGPTTASKTKLKIIEGYLKGRQRCVLNFPWVGKLDEVIHVTVDADWETQRQGASLLEECWQSVRASLKGCIEALYVKHLLEHQTARPFKIEVWTDSSSSKAIMQRLGPGRRAKHLEVQTMWVQQNKIGLISLNLLNTLENVADLLTKHVSRAVLDKLAGMMGYTFPVGETQKFQEYANINQNYWNQKMAAVERLPVFDDGENDSLEDDVQRTQQKRARRYRSRTSTLIKHVLRLSNRRRWSRKQH